MNHLPGSSHQIPSYHLTHTHTHTAYCQSASISQSDGVWRGNRVAFVKLSLECGLNVCVCVCVCEYGGRRAAHFLWTDFGKTNILWSAVIVKYVCWHVLFHFTGSVPGMDGLSNTGQHTETNNRSCTIDTKVWSCDLFAVRQEHYTFFHYAATYTSTYIYIKHHHHHHHCHFSTVNLHPISHSWRISLMPYIHRYKNLHHWHHLSNTSTLSPLYCIILFC